MDFKRERYEIEKIIQSWRSKELIRNDEYQRGAAWSTAQKQALVDSIFRNYPIPPLFLQKKVSPGGISSTDTQRFEIVDGQQRILALVEFSDDKWELLDPVRDKKLKLPDSLRTVPAPWAKKTFSDLDRALRTEQFLKKKIEVYLLEDSVNSDEVRDLFIRLQSGTPLTRQQVRDAWPGSIGPYIERMAGKLDRRPRYHLFQQVRKAPRGEEEDEERDPYVEGRLMCAQMFKVYLDRATDPFAEPGISANEVDALYHDHTALNIPSPITEQFESALGWASEVCKYAQELSVRHREEGKSLQQTKRFSKLAVVSLMMLHQDLSRNKQFRWTQDSTRKAGEKFLGLSTQGAGRGMSGKKVRAYYESVREQMEVEKLGVRLDSQRLFSEEQKATIFKRDKGLCQECTEQVAREDADYDHYPVQHRDGGQTTVENGRLVHRRCHPRPGRPVQK